MEINHPETHTLLRDLALQYEEALTGNDVETLTAMFWNSPHVMRFGVTENLYGADELEAFRRSRPSVGLARRVVRLDIVCFGDSFGSVTLEFEREVAGRIVRGRQSQTWVRLEEGWRIVAAHVSLLPTKS
jgi:hypothetical protein